MPQRSARTAACLAALTLTVATLASCTVEPAPEPTTVAPEPTTAVPEPTPSLRNYVAESRATASAEASAAEARAQEEYAAAVAAFPLAMPDGYAFPETIPSSQGVGAWTYVDARQTAYAVWRCSVAQAARDAYVLDSDAAAAEALLSTIPAVSDDDLRSNSDWVEMVMPPTGVSWGSLEGETGMCYFWLRPFGRWNV
ncbi:MAG: hypothetical protein WBX17_06750 [Microbacterium sp.]